VSWTMITHKVNTSVPFLYISTCNLNVQGGVFVNLEKNPERFTGYAGPSAQRIWKAIYEENCFGMPQMSPMLKMQECVEHQLYYKIISGKQLFVSESCFLHLTMAYNRTSRVHFHPLVL
jgi:hypothetical protein